MALSFYITSFSGVFSVDRYVFGASVDALNFGGDDPNGTLTASDVILNLGASRHSPRFLQAFAEQTTHKVVIKGYEPNVQGVEHNFLTITLTGAKVSAYHLAGAERARLTETMHLTFTTLDFDSLDTATDYIWQPA